MKIFDTHHPSSPLTIDERVEQIYLSLDRDIHNIGFSTKRAFIKEHLLMVQRSGGFTKLPEVDNKMQMLRRFAAAHKSGDPINLTRKDSIELSEAILSALTCIDEFWETVAGRQLTDEEKWGKE